MKILVIEDDSRQRTLLKMSLESFLDIYCEVVEADRLSAGVGILEQNNIDAVVLDLGLVDNLGLEGVTKLRQVNDHAVIFILSGAGHVNDAMNAIKLGADDYWKKPLHDVEQFVWSLAGAVERRRRREKAEVKKHRMSVGVQVAWISAFGTVLAGLLTALVELLK